MSLWSFDIIRADGQLFAYIRVQDDYTGNIAGRFAKVHQEDFDYYFRAEHKRVLCTRQVEALRTRECNIEAEHDFYKKYKGFIR